MDDLKKEKTEGFDWAYIADVLTQKQAVGDRYIDRGEKYIGRTLICGQNILDT